MKIEDVKPGAWVEFQNRDSRIVGRVMRVGRDSAVLEAIGGMTWGATTAELEPWTPRPGDWVRRTARAIATHRQDEEGPWQVKHVTDGDVLLTTGWCLGRGWIEPCAQPAHAPSASDVAALGMTTEEWHRANGREPQPAIAPLPMSDAARAYAAWIDGAGSFVDAAAAAVACGAISPEEMAAINEAAARDAGSCAAVANRMPAFGAPKATETAAMVLGFDPSRSPEAERLYQQWIDSRKRVRPECSGLIVGQTVEYIIVDDPHKGPRTHNTTCPRCGKRAYQGIGDVQCVEPVCDDPETRMPDSVRRQPERVRPRDGSPPPPYERPRYEHVFVAWGRDVSAKHPTRDGAIQTWREAVAAKGGAA